MLHLKPDLIKEYKIIGFANKKYKSNVETTLKIITQLTILPLGYKSDINYLYKKVKISFKHTNYYNTIHLYFVDVKLKYFVNGIYNYSKNTKNIKSNIILKGYNKIVKTDLGEKVNVIGYSF